MMPHVAAFAEQHLDDVGGVLRRIVLHPGQAAGHAQQVVDGDGPARIPRGAPGGNLHRRMDIEPPVGHGDPHQGVGEPEAQTRTEQRRDSCGGGW